MVAHGLVLCLLLQGSLPLGELIGCWRQIGGEGLLAVEAERVLSLKDDRLAAAARLAASSSRALAVRRDGLKETWPWSYEKGILTLTTPRGEERYSSLPTCPSELETRFSPLPTRVELSSERIAAIQSELSRRIQQDQAVRQEKGWERDPEALAGTDRDNFRYLTSLVAEVGWIDSRRFGRKAAAAALVLAKHQPDLRFLLAIAPHVERDFLAGGLSPDLYAIFYDEFQIAQGRRQLFGTQLAEDAEGPFVVALEDPENIEALRQAVGLSPLREYLLLAQEHLYDGKAIRILKEE